MAKKKKKRKASPTILAWSSCRMDAGVKPGKTMSDAQKARVRACVDKKLERKNMAKKKRR